MRNGDNDVAGLGVDAGVGAAVGLSVGVGAAAGAGANSGQVNNKNLFVRRTRFKESDDDSDSVGGDEYDDDDEVDGGETDTSKGWPLACYLQHRQEREICNEEYDDMDAVWAVQGEQRPQCG